jgi:hypothetical protein
MKFGVFNFLFFVFLQVVALCASAFAVEQFDVNFNDKMFSKLSDAEKSVLADYAKVYPQIKNYYQNMRMDAIKKTFRYTKDDEGKIFLLPGEEPILLDESVYEIRFNISAEKGTFRRIDVLTRFIKSDIPETIEKNESHFHSRSISLVDAQKATELVKVSPKSTYYALESQLDLKEREDTYGHSVQYFDTSPFAAGSWLMEDIIFKIPVAPNIKSQYFIDHVKEVMIDGEPIVEIKTSYENKVVTRIVKLYKKNWLVKESTRTLSNGTYNRTLCVYGDKGHYDFPPLDRYQIDFGIYDVGDQNKKKLVRQFQFEVVKFVHGPPSLSEFDVAQFLPPGNKIGVKTVVFTLARIVCIVAGLILFFIGVYMKVRLANKK